MSWPLSRGRHQHMTMTAVMTRTEVLDSLRSHLCHKADRKHLPHFPVKLSVASSRGGSAMACLAEVHKLRN